MITTTQNIQKIVCNINRKRLFADTLSVNKKIFADTLSVNKKLFADTLSANKKISADSKSANNKLDYMSNHKRRHSSPKYLL